MIYLKLYSSAAKYYWIFHQDPWITPREINENVESENKKITLSVPTEGFEPKVKVRPVPQSEFPGNLNTSICLILLTNQTKKLVEVTSTDLIFLWSHALNQFFCPPGLLLVPPARNEKFDVIVFKCVSLNFIQSNPFEPVLDLYWSQCSSQHTLSECMGFIMETQFFF